MSVSEVWERCEAATADHPYIVSKGAVGIPLASLRVVRAGDIKAGYLVVPAYASDGSMQSLQYVSPNGSKKLSLTGSPIGGAWFTVGDLVYGGTVYLCEGVSTAWSCWQAKSQRAVSCFGTANMERVAESLRELDPTAKLVLVPDAGQEKSATLIAAAVGGAVAFMPEGEPSNFDANDFMQREGPEALALLLDAAFVPATSPPLLTRVSVGDVISNPSPPPEFIWESYLPRGVTSLMGAHGGTGKGWVGLMLAIMATLGRPLFGVATVQCKALFVSLEDSAAIVRYRLAYICRVPDIDPALLDGNLQVVDGTAHPELYTAESRGSGDTTETYAELHSLVEVEGFGLVVVDNASDAFAADEIVRRQVRPFIRSLTKIALLTNCAVLLMAHVDKNTSRGRKTEGSEGYSGSTAWNNSVRSRLFMTRAENDGPLKLEHQKANHSKKREDLTLIWPENGLPMLESNTQQSALIDALMGRAEDERAINLLRMIAEFESRQQYCSPATTSRSHVYAVLRSDLKFQQMKLGPDAVKRLVAKCQRAKWIEIQEYRTLDRKWHQRWATTPFGFDVAGLSAPTAPTVPTTEDGAPSADSAAASAPTAPTGVGGVGERAHPFYGDASAPDGACYD
jgi:RecA-family ATPase